MRFDKKRHTWKLWDASSGFPEYDELTGIAGDGTSALVTTYLFGAYRLNPKTQRWENVSPALTRALVGGRNDIDLFAYDLFADPPFVWIRAFGYWKRSHTPATNDLTPVPPLIRWDGVHARFETLPLPNTGNPRDKTFIWGTATLVDPNAVWLVATAGLWRLDKASKAWRFFAAPDDFWAYHDEIRRTPDGAIWLLGNDDAVRWMPPDNPEKLLQP